MLQLEDKLSTLSRRKDSESGNRLALQQQIRDLSEKLRAESAVVVRVQREAQDLKETLAGVTSANESYQEKVASVTRSKEAAEGKLRSLQKELQQARQAREHLEERDRELSSSVKHQEQELNEMRRKSVDTDQQFLAISRTVGALEKEKSELEYQLRTMSQRSVVLTDQLQCLREESASENQEVATEIIGEWECVCQCCRQGVRRITSTPHLQQRGRSWKRRLNGGAKWRRRQPVPSVTLMWSTWT